MTTTLGTESIPLTGRFESADLSKLVYMEQIRLIGRQTPAIMLGEIFASGFLCFALWNVFPHWQLIYWMAFILFTSVWNRSFLAWYVQKIKPNDSTRIWTALFLIGAFCSGIGWGITGLIFMNTPELLHQTFVVFILLGVTAGASTYYSSIPSSYTLFLLPAILPFSYWLFTQGTSYLFLGVGSLIFVTAMLISSFYASRLLKSAITLQFELRNMDYDNKLLEKKVADRTAALEKALDFTKSTLESTTDGIMMIDSAGRIEYFNQKFLSMWKITRQQIASQRTDRVIQLIATQLKQPDDLLMNIKQVSLNNGIETYMDLDFIDGKVFECYSKPHWHEGEIIGHVWSFRDVTVRNKLAHRANHDQLTDLPNRSLFYDRIEQGIVFAKRRHTQLTLLFIDLDNFKTINDTLGHSAGDLLLKEIARRLKESIRDSDTVARFGGDEFVILLVESEQTGILQLSQSLLKKISEPVRLNTQDVVISASIGISMYPKDGDNAMSLLKNADMAMYLAKKKGRNNVQFYNEIIYQQSIDQLKTQTELYDALVNKEFFIEYQPIISLKDASVTGAEALVRWHHPSRGVIYPGDFIPLAEKNGIIYQLGSWVFHEACQQIKRWHNEGQYICMCINISYAQMKGTIFSDMVEKSLTEFDLDARYLELEFTEKAIMENIDQIKETLSRFNKMGIQMAIDNFGIGYSSINYLKAFPINKLKIDRSFISQCDSDPDKQSIIKTIISLGKNLNLTLLAEGVETLAELRFLKENGCNEVQGNLFSQSVNNAVFMDILTHDFKKIIFDADMPEKN
ncbi:putative bifunctional diguanylate cyclase/phosphodiesterase [Legionella sp. CNM-4043-24]|uniref:putative bifunctional diguanylate cyclase/phosphodiesterase n=1 Tax=Legionella sp. CNM-4043-24 TaxID=3421646 RepID=UPI00403AFE75